MTSSNSDSLDGCQRETSKILFIEAFYGGSHKQLLDTVIKNVTSYTLVTLKAKKWHWRARCSAMVLSSLIPSITTEKVLFTSSVVNLAELLGIRPDLQSLRKIVYFHENQLVYPVKIIKERDIQYAYNQIVTCLAADCVVFNSEFNKESFLNNIHTITKLLPDYRPRDLYVKIKPKCEVLYFPIDFPVLPSARTTSNVLTIVWPHRWEFDKNPESFFKLLYKLEENNKRFRISILGEAFAEVPEVFLRAQEHFQNEIIQFGYLETKNDYFEVLCSSHIVVSTADHEFFGSLGITTTLCGGSMIQMLSYKIAARLHDLCYCGWVSPLIICKYPFTKDYILLEATYAGCFPLAPNKLVYPEIYPPQCLYDTEDQLYMKLSAYCDDPALAVLHRGELNIDFDLYSSEKLMPRYLDLLCRE